MLHIPVNIIIASIRLSSIYTGSYIVASKKQIFLPIGVLVLAGGLFVAFSAMKKPPEQKQQETVAPLVEVTPVQLTDVTMKVNWKRLLCYCNNY